MKNKVLVLISLLLVIVMNGCTSNSAGGGKSFNGMTVTAHAGAMGTVENQIEGIIYTAPFADIVEVDVRFDEKSEPVLGHDENISGASTLEEAFKAMQEFPNVQMNLDLKEFDDPGIERIEILAHQYNMTDRVFFTGASYAEARIVRDCCSLPFYINIKGGFRTNFNSYAKRIIKQAKELAAIGVNLHYAKLVPGFVTKMHESGLLVSVWTVDNKDDFASLASMGVDNITTKELL